MFGDASSGRRAGDWEEMRYADHTSTAGIRRLDLGRDPRWLRSSAGLSGQQDPVRSPVWPPPHHFDVDGTYVYASAPDPLLIRRTTSDEVGMVGGGEEIVIRSLSDESGRRRWAFPRRFLNASFPSTEAKRRLFSIEPCDISSARLAVRCAGYEWDPLSPSPVEVPELTAFEVITDCGNTFVAEEYTARERWLVARRCSPRGDSRAVEAFGGGRLRHTSGSGTAIPLPFPGDESQIPERTPSGQKPPPAPRLRVSRDRNLDLKQLFSQLLQNPTTTNLHGLGQIATSNLMPYVRAAVARRNRPVEGINNGIRGH